MQQLLIDTDPGVDDAYALLMALSHAQAQVVAITVTAGNVGLAHTVRNALRVIDTVGQAIPVHAGCLSPFLAPPPGAGFVHGDDGFGDAGLPQPKSRVSAGHAVDAMLDLSRRRPGELTFVCLGPLTNLATALMLDPRLPERVPRLVIMGGAVNGRGNTERLNAEFNIGFDPEAADIVFRHWPQFELVDWEATLAHGVPFDTLEQWLAQDTANARLLQAISAKRHAWVRAHRSASHSHLADALAMAVVLEPALVREALERPLSVSLAGAHTRGMTVVDWLQRGGQPANARIVQRVDQAGFEALIERTLRA